MNNYQIIGTTQYIQLPGHSKNDVLAKVDTGADQSSIWASSIHEQDGKLSFVLFAPKSVYYTGKVHTTSDYMVTSVKNSFGASEYRYKVKLRMAVMGKVYKTSFNLADRSHNRYPLLIGKKFLKNRFVVDVSHRDVSGESVSKADKRPVVVLVTGATEDLRNFFDKVAESMSSELILASYGSLRFNINKNGEPKIILSDGRDIASAKVVYFKSYSFYPEHAAATAKYLQYKHVPFFDKELAGAVSRSKLSELFILATSGILVPQTSVITGIKNIPNYADLKKHFGKMFVIKDALSDKGKNNYLVVDNVSYEKAITRLKTDNIKIFIIQKYIKNDGFLRVLLMGKSIAQIIKRTQSEHRDSLKAHLNKPFGGTNASEISKTECGSDVISIARKSAFAMRRTVAGIDLIQDILTKKWYVLEVNYNPETIGGYNPSGKAKALAKLLERKR